ncbi:MAG: hypothetical protein HY454_03800 [Parcubacteria group bacterium]|nr:hypothetical protein [Parcubacteria group bacterium]
MPDNLEELQKKLYTPSRPVLPKPEQPLPSEAKPPSAELPPLPDEPSASGWRKIKIGLAVFFLLALSAGAFVFYRGFYAFRKDRVELSLSGPESITAGEEAVWRVSIVNRNETPLREGRLVFHFPDFSSPQVPTEMINQQRGRLLEAEIDIEQIQPGEKLEHEFRARVYGGEGFEKKAQAIFKFKPAAGNIVFESSREHQLTISSFPVDLSVNLARQTLSGETVSVGFDLANRGQASFNDLRLRLEYPSGFRVLAGSEKLGDFNNTWRLEEFLPSETKTLTLMGLVNGSPGETKVFRAFVEGREGETWRVYKESSGQVQLIGAPLVLEMSAEPVGLNSIALGGVGVVKVKWANTLDVPLADVVLKIKLSGEAVDFAKLVANGLPFDSLARENVTVQSATLVWNEGNLADLASLNPSAEGELTLEIRIKDKLPLASASRAVAVEAAIESPAKPEGLAVSKIFSSRSLNFNVGN